MGQVNVQIGGRSYSLACGDGEETHLAGLASHLDRKTAELQAALGQMSEPRLLLMAGILMADELHELRSGKAPPAAVVTDADYDDLAARLERLAAALENDATSA
jgi:cell division protein ZapA